MGLSVCHNGIVSKQLNTLSHSQRHVIALDFSGTKDNFHTP